MRPRTLVLLCSVCTVLLASPVGLAGEEFYGTIESRPKENVGTWVVGGRSLQVTARTRLDEDYGPLVVGVCVEVEHEGKVAIEIASEEKKRCLK